MYKLFSSTMLTSVCSVLISLSLTLFCSRYFSVEHFGDIRYVMTLIPLFVIAGFPGFDRVVLKAGFDRVSIDPYNILKARFFSSLLVCSLAYYFVDFSVEDDSQYSSILKNILFLIPFYELFSTYKNYLIGGGHYSRAAAIYLVSRLSSLVLFIFFLLMIWINNLGFMYVIPLYLISLIIPQSIAYFKVFRFSPLLKNFFFLPSTALLKDGAFSTMAGALTTLAFSLDKIMVFNLFGAESLALYTILIMIPQEVSRLIDSFIPYIYKSLDKYKLDPYRVCFVLVLCIPVYMLIFSNTSSLIFGEDFIYDYPEIFLSAVLIISQSLEFYFTQRLYIDKGGKILLYHSLTNNLLTFLLIYILGGSFGFVGFLSALIIKNISISAVAKYVVDTK